MNFNWFIDLSKKKKSIFHKKLKSPGGSGGAGAPQEPPGPFVCYCFIKNIIKILKSLFYINNDFDFAFDFWASNSESHSDVTQARWWDRSFAALWMIRRASLVPAHCILDLDF